MVNEEKIGVYQNCGKKDWWQNKMPENVSVYSTLEELKKSQPRGCLIISDEQIQDNEILENAVIYRPPSLVVGIGLHWDTTKDKIIQGLDDTLKKFNLSIKSIARFVSIKKEKDVVGLNELADEMNIPLEVFDKDELATIKTPNPSKMVEGYEGTASVSEAAAIKSSGGNLIVEKQKFPPDLTIAIARINE
jgi:cobalt-precorrin 5A hydrolase